MLNFFPWVIVLLGAKVLCHLLCAPSLTSIANPAIAPAAPVQQRRPRSLSESEVIVKSSLESFIYTAKLATSVPALAHLPPNTNAEDVLGEVLYSPDKAMVSESEAPMPEWGRRARATSDMSELVGASQRAARAVDLLGTITAHSSTSTLDADADAGEASERQDGETQSKDTLAAAATGAVDTGTAQQADETVTKADTTAPKDESSAVSWIWRWGYLPVKTKPKSTTDLEDPPQPQQTLPEAPSTDAPGPPTSGNKGSKIDSTLVITEHDHSGSAVSDSNTVSAAQPPAPGGLRDSRGRAVSLPLMFPAMNDDGSGTMATRRLTSREGRASIHSMHIPSKRSPYLAGLGNAEKSGEGFTLKVTAVEGGLCDLGAEASHERIAAVAQQENEVNKAAFASMFDAAVHDTSRFQALSLCGNILSAPTSSTLEANHTSDGVEQSTEPTAENSSAADTGSIETYPTTQAALMRVLDAHRISPKDIAVSPPVTASSRLDSASPGALELLGVADIHPTTTADRSQGSVLQSPHLVVILNDFLLPIAAAEILLSSACKTNSVNAGDVSANAGEGGEVVQGAEGDTYTTDSEVAAVLDDLAAELLATGRAPLPVWAGRRISLWGTSDIVRRDSSSAEAQPETEHGQVTHSDAHSANSHSPSPNASPSSRTARDDGATPLGHLTWKESFSDLVQAYRVRNIQSIHSMHVSGAGSGRDSYVTSPFLQEFVSPGKHTLSYRELWRRQQHMGKSGSFTTLLTLDGGSNSIYGNDEEKWASSDDAHDGYGVGMSLHPERLSDSSSHSLIALAAIEEAHEQAEFTAAKAMELTAEPAQVTTASAAVPSVVNVAAAVPSSPAIAATAPALGTGITASYMRDAPPRSLYPQHALPTDEDGGSQRSLSVADEGDTTDDNLSIQDIDLEDISPEPAGGDFYDSDTDSYLSLSLEDDSGSVGSGKASYGSAYGAGFSAHGGTAEPPKRRFKKYRYRKVLVPSQEQLDLLDLRDGPNEIVFELPGCVPLKSCLFVWPADAKVVVTDLEGVFSKKTNAKGGGVWINFLGGGSYYSTPALKTEFDACIKLFRSLHAQGYRIIYIAQGSLSSSSASSLLSSQDYLSSIKTSTGECLPPGPIFKSPDSLVRAFGAARTEVFKASALRGVKSLFPTTHNPYHACFCTREGDAVPFARFGFPEGRIFLVSEKGDIKSANRTCILSFPKLIELLHQIFPMVIGKFCSCCPVVNSCVCFCVCVSSVILAYQICVVL